jgi:hypothetical protein
MSSQATPFFGEECLHDTSTGVACLICQGAY